MSRHIMKCPCCGEEVKIAIDRDGEVSAISIFIDKIPISQEKLSEDFGIELGIVDSSDDLEE